MSEIIDRIAAIYEFCESNGDGPKDAARLIIAAMRKPATEMILAAQMVEHNTYWPDKTPSEHSWQGTNTMLMTKMWQAMIDEASKP